MLRAVSLLTVGALAVAGALFGAPGQVRAGGAIFVTTSEDELNDDGDCSLREAVMAVNAQAPIDACAGASGARNVFISPGTYLLTIPGAGEDAGATGDLDVLRAISIDPTDAGQVTIDAGGLDRIFDIHASATTFRTVLRSVVLRNGDAGAQDGGAVRVSDVACDGSPGSHRDIELFGVVLDGGRAARGGGLHVGSCNLADIVYSSIVANSATEVGGGISIVGDSIVSIDTSTISGNIATTAGGGVWSDVPEPNWGVRYSTVALNRADDGGGIWSTAPTFAGPSILTQNEGGNCGGPGGATAGGVSDDATCGSQAVGDAGILALTTIGGMPVHPLSPDSPAIDSVGVPVTPWCNDIGPTDQVGNPRPVDGDGDGVAECDAGAFEAPAVSVTPPSSPLPNTAMSTGRAESPSGLPSLVLASGLGASILVLAGRLSPTARRRECIGHSPPRRGFRCFLSATPVTRMRR